MKSGALKLGLAFSLLFHAGLLGGLVWYGGRVFHPARLLQRDPVVVLTMVSAPPDVPAPESKPVVTPASLIQPPPPVEIPKPPVATKPSAPPVTAIKTPEPVPAPAPAPTPVPKELAATPPPQPTKAPVGDGKSPDPGLDAVTQKAVINVRAEANYLKNPEPAYPVSARRRGETGKVLLLVKVTAEGRAGEVTVKESSGFSLLDDAALKAVREWEFAPARIGSMPVESEIEVPVRFVLAK